MTQCIGPSLTAKEIQKYRGKYGFYPELEELAEFYNVLSHPLRLKIVHLLREQGELCVCDLSDIFDTSMPCMSQHLAKMRAYKVLRSEKRGQTVFYSLAEHALLEHVKQEGA